MRVLSAALPPPRDRRKVARIWRGPTARGPRSPQAAGAAVGLPMKPALRPRREASPHEELRASTLTAAPSGLGALAPAELLASMFRCNPPLTCPR